METSEDSRKPRKDSNTVPPEYQSIGTLGDNVDSNSGSVSL
jgi:hypothetical protein